jgi:rsbT co-antagonist protein RsbR
LNPHIAQTVVHMGLDLSDIVTHRSLRDALYRYVAQAPAAKTPAVAPAPG